MANKIATNTTQSLFDYESIRRNFPSIQQDGTDDYAGKGRDIARIINAFNQLVDEFNTVSSQIGPESGTGSPEGVTTSTLSQLYVDTNVNQLYYNPVVGVNTGWVSL